MYKQIGCSYGMASLQIFTASASTGLSDLFYMSQEIQALHFFQTYADRLGTFEDCRLPARLCQVWLDETSIIDISDGSNIVVSAFNTPRYDFEMVHLQILHGLIAFGGWNIRDGL